MGPFGHYGCDFAFGMLLYERRSPVFVTIFFIAGVAGVYWMAQGLGFGFAAPFVWAVGTVLCVAVVFWNDTVLKVTRSIPTRTLGLMTYPLYLIHDTVGTTVLGFGIVAAFALSFLVAFAILPLEEFIRLNVFSNLSGRLPTGNPV